MLILIMRFHKIVLPMGPKNLGNSKKKDSYMDHKTIIIDIANRSLRSSQKANNSSFRYYGHFLLII